ncbi:hypothetical protein BpHYR1_011083 [Brachionus plicatilis]|uniref:Uncharacterized protein n=1 Tax=Brachionus plicatilis TaxID=10195 RepID=A0A3M7RXW6_BRAPC|nr:hypothetical protein BpHYR1_011083 [Brachionus plicatilis]
MNRRIAIKGIFEEILPKYLCVSDSDYYLLGINPIGKITKNYIKFDSILIFICEHTNLTESTKPRFLPKNI